MQAATFTQSIKLATLAAALALSGMAATASAADSTVAKQVSPAATGVQVDPAAAPCGKKFGRHHGKHARGHMGNAALFIPGYGPVSSAVVDSLSLTDSQAKLVQAARDAQKAGMESRRDTMKSMKTARIAQVKAGKIDPEAALKQAQEARTKAYEERSKLDENWLAVWDALDASQQEKVSTYLTERAEQRAQQPTRNRQSGKMNKMAS
jgi:Spy/CpxP family protein refolding chaperone